MYVAWIYTDMVRARRKWGSEGIPISTVGVEKLTVYVLSHVSPPQTLIALARRAGNYIPRMGG